MRTTGTEREFQKRFLNYLKERYPKAWVYKIPDTAGLGGRRPFDVIMILEGRVYCIELKRNAKSVVTKWQLYQLQKASDAGAHTAIIHPENMEEKLEAWKLYP